MNIWIQKHLEQLSIEGKSPRTIEGYRIDLQQFEDYLESEFGGCKIPEISAIHIRGFLRWLSERPDGNRTLSRKLSALATWFKYLKIEGQILDNPMRKIRRPKFERKLPKFFSEEEMQALLRIPDTSSKFGLRNRAILELLYSCGLRLMELAGLRLSDIDQRKKLIRVIGKGNKQRLIPIGSFALESLNEYLALRPDFVTEDSSDKVFLTRNGKDFDSKQLLTILMRYIALIAREKGYSPHAIRHSFATHLLSHGADLMAIKEMMGHVNLSTTETYTHLSLADIKAAYEKGHPRSGE
ncbi:MAG: tyrosine-type recombinase/integrase [Candidatus Cloacimonetes bacterium]|nr:tyrosine-type recombinase/integrase [Candidatus Cloacimonadota bacterium]